METPASLLERLRQPLAADAWPRFVRIYTPLLFAWSRRLGLQEADAADLVQDVLAHLLRKLPTFTYDGQRSFQAWLRTVLVNQWRDRRPTPPGIAAELDGLADPAPTDAAEVAEYRRVLVERALRIMQADFQPATWKACWELVVAGRPASEIAPELGLTVAGVYAAKYRVIGRLRQELAGLWE